MGRAQLGVVLRMVDEAAGCCTTCIVVSAQHVIVLIVIIDEEEIVGSSCLSTPGYRLSLKVVSLKIVVLATRFDTEPD